MYMLLPFMRTREASDGSVELTSLTSADIYERSGLRSDKLVRHLRRRRRQFTHRERQPLPEAAQIDATGLLGVPLPFVVQVKHRRRGVTRISRKNQATLPIDALRQAGLKPGDELMVEAAGAGRIVLVRAVDLVERHAGKALGVYPPNYLTELRDEWR